MADAQHASGKQLIAALDSLYGVATYVSRERAWEEFAQELGGTELLEAVGGPPSVLGPDMLARSRPSMVRRTRSPRRRPPLRASPPRPRRAAQSLRSVPTMPTKLTISPG